MRLIFFLLLIPLLRGSATADVLLDDTWSDATRTDTALPAESAWHASNTASLTASANALTGTAANGSSRSWWTYFTTNAAAPVPLAEGETLRATLVFTLDAVAAQNTSRGMRIGLFDFSGGTRTTADGSSPAGAGVAGYVLNLNMGTTFGVAGPVSIRKRTTLTSTDLMGSAGDFTTLPEGDGGGSTGSPGFVSGSPHTVVWTFNRTAAGLEITAAFSRADGWSVTHTATDPAPASLLAFDGFALRPASSTQSAGTFLFSRLLVEKLNAIPPGPPEIDVPPQSVTAQAGDTVQLSVSASGPPALSYQWRLAGADLPGETSATLTLTNVQAGGSYTVVVSNPYGSAETSAAVLTVLPQAPVFTAQPAGRAAIAGDTVTFLAAARGTQPMTWQWTRDNAPISGQTAPQLTLTNAQPSAAGTYRVIATSSAGATTSNPAILTVTNAVIVPGLYVSPSGTAGAAGSFSAPTTLASAITRVQPGGVIWVRGGTYTLSSQITVNRGNNGTSEALRKQIFAFRLPDGTEEVPVLDFSSQPYGSTSSVSNPRGLMLGGDWWHVRGLTVKGAADNGIYVGGNHNIVERCRTHLCRDSGVQVSRFSSSDATIDLWPSYNLILNCESWDNYDSPPNDGENADGFACKLTSGPGNIFRGCVAHHNIDDGWDLFTKTDTGPIGSVIIDRCIAHSNGTLTDGTSNVNGDRNGFKLGGDGIPVVHTVTRSLAFGNGKNGFTWNSNPGAIIMVNNLAFDNAEGNYNFTAAGPQFYSNVSLYTTGTGVNDRYGGSSGAPTGATNCFWYTGSSSRGPSINDAGIVVNAASFQTLAPPTFSFIRRADGALDFGNFARPVAGHRLVNGGILPAGIALPFSTAYYLGTPDAGLVESRTGFQLWREQQFGEDNLGRPYAAADAAPGGDGHSSMLRYILGADATAPLSPALLPAMVSTPGGLRYRWRRAPGTTDIRALPWASEDLAAWTSLPAALFTTAGGYQEWEAAAPAGTTRGYFRLQLSPQP